MDGSYQITFSPCSAPEILISTFFPRASGGEKGRYSTDRIFSASDERISIINASFFSTTSLQIFSVYSMHTARIGRGKQKPKSINAISLENVVGSMLVQPYIPCNIEKIENIGNKSGYSAKRAESIVIRAICKIEPFSDSIRIIFSSPLLPFGTDVLPLFGTRPLMNKETKIQQLPSKQLAKANLPEFARDVLPCTIMLLLCHKQESIKMPSMQDYTWRTVHASAIEMYLSEQQYIVPDAIGDNKRSHQVNRKMANKPI